jgi:nitroreductase
MYKINPLILNRWSPRSMTGEVLGDDDMLSLFEAARWAPSSSNNQPWRFSC